MPSDLGLLVCLLPVRNGEGHLPEYLAGVGRFADAVVALDDGSTDATASLLAASPLVRRALSNPCRIGYRGWDDGTNRNRLLAAAGELGAQWILSLDVDERMDEADGLAMRWFIAHQAQPGRGYLLPVFAATGSADRVKCGPLWVGRLFRYEPGQVFSSARLHGMAIPRDIPRRHWVKTTLRARHPVAISTTARRGRYDKYRDADPQRRWQASYEHLLEEPQATMAWLPRPPGLPAIRHQPGPVPDGPRDEPVMTAVVIATDDENRIATVLEALEASEGIEAADFEIVVVCSGSPATAAIARERFPKVRLVELAQRVLPGAARNAGLRLARGRYVSFPGSHVTVATGNLAALVSAHEQGYALVMGAMANGTRTRAGWASYLLDNHTALPGRAAGRLGDPPVRCSYLKAALDAAGPFPEHQRTAEETVINTRLFRLGYGAYREPAAISTHVSACGTPGRLLHHHFGRGRGLAPVLLEMRREGSAVPAVALNLTAGAPRRLLLALTAALRWGGEDRRELLGSFPLAVAAAAASWAGTVFQLVRSTWPRRSRARARV